MTDTRTYSHKFVEEFIALYKSMPCLWKLSNKDYTNRHIRNIAYEKLLKKLKEVEPDADKDMVVKKINCLRGSFRREHRKVMESKYSDTPYEPHLWYYDLLLFTADQEVFKKRRLSIDSDSIDYECELENSEIELDFRTDLQDALTPTVELLESKQNQKICASSSKKQKRNYDEMSCINCTQVSMCHLTDQYDHFAQNIASKLREMNKIQSIIAEKLISEVVFYGQLDQLNMESAQIFSSSISQTANCYSPVNIPASSQPKL